MKEEYQIIDYFQLLIDLGAVQHITVPQKRFTNSGNYYQFSIPLNNKEMKDAFISSTTNNYNQFKLVQSFISNRNNVCQLYNSTFSVHFVGTSWIWFTNLDFCFRCDGPLGQQFVQTLFKLFLQLNGVKMYGRKRCATHLISFLKLIKLVLVKIGLMSWQVLLVDF
jgi:hypothetical protein